MANRRKFIAGLGALATGSAAAMGTGAFTSASATRAVNADIVADDNAYLGLTADLDLGNQPNPEDTPDSDTDSPRNNTEYAVNSGSGKLRLVFNEESGAGGSGLGADSVYYFDNIFGIRNQSNGDQLRIDIDDSGLDNSGAFQFYTLYQNGDPIAGRDSLATPGMNAGQGVNVGVKIQTPSTITEDWETGTINIIAEDYVEGEDSILR
ncbi:DUF1102 domain-containing protein [Halorubrum saccharovorum]|uniref:DUF1102 domain-containing protein n=1 Tax=Halorubrum saccharovorum TaxID=2248 RepID=UPI0009B5BF02|nr:DUF1102 domain-containing protein [Halorubrum saccharovorum]